MTEPFFLFEIVAEEFDGSGIVLETGLRYGTDIASSIVGTAHDSTAGPRGERSVSATRLQPRGTSTKG